MLFVKTLSDAEVISLQWMTREHPLPWTRIRANSVLLSHQKIALQSIARLYNVSRQTTSVWLKKMGKKWNLWFS